MPLLSYVYGRYADRTSALRRLWLRALSWPPLARALLGVRVRAIPSQPQFFDLTTLLLRRVVAPLIAARPDLAACEMGVGAYAALAGPLSRRARRPIVALDNDPARVAAARAHAAAHGFTLDVRESDLFSAAAGEAFDLVFWNLPYYRDPRDFLARLFAQAPAHLRPGGRLVIGYNSRPLPRATVLALLADQPALRLERVHTWRWNLHEVLVLAAAPVAGGGAGAGPDGQRR